MSFITTYCQIKADICLVNGSVFAEKSELSGDNWFKQLYKSLAVEYPKFYKMDMLSQAAFIGSEVIKRLNPDLTTAYQDDEVALLFANMQSSGDTDLRFRESYQKQRSPSPSLFVYTLPNIAIGEIAIRNKWYGENMFAVLPNFAPDFFLNYSDVLLTTGSKAVLAGWLGIMEGDIQVSVFLIEKDRSDGLPLNKENLIQCAGIRDQA